MRKIVRVNGKKVLLDTDKDVCLYDATHAFYKRTGNQNNLNRGVDLYARERGLDNPVFYELHWSRYQGEVDYIEVLTPEEAARFIEQNFDVFDDDDIETLKRLGLFNPDEVI